jgi:excinuclease UvrABC ATPase subunit
VSHFVYRKGDIKTCELCEGNGVIYVWRSDLEDFEMILCPECQGTED